MAGLVLDDDRGAEITQAMATAKILHLSTKTANYHFDLLGFTDAVHQMRDCFAAADELHTGTKQ